MADQALAFEMVAAQAVTRSFSGLADTVIDDDATRPGAGTAHRAGAPAGAAAGVALHGEGLHVFGGGAVVAVVVFVGVAVHPHVFVPGEQAFGAKHHQHAVFALVSFAIAGAIAAARLAVAALAGFVLGGGVAIATSALLFVLAPSDEAKPGNVALTPVVGPGIVGLRMGGSFE